ncbi:DUF2236 domain-containing protein [Caulobacter vibrioides]|uniref:DUF2236 domain-containing protein n=1 Tax=Caulobacter vibrioides TaxID=155892 RepID=A0A290MSB5_CAUVI|nr:oxygenase MpaB family protein [Caulobacter vibrioides]ATC31227.1 DUF2236 domain-containing protein [Caulobacter vibrioides]
MIGPSSYLGWKIDYASPPGEPALLDPGSMHWRVYKNPIALAVGGVAAVLLEFAEPRIRSGVWDHSTFKTDPIGRAMRTGTAALIGVYGPASAARRVIQGVTHMHERVSGETPDGQAYTALDPELLNWVAATAVYGFVTAYDQFVAPLTEADKTRFYEEAAPVAHLYGATASPGSEAAFMAMLQALSPRFEPHPIVDEFLATIRSSKIAPAAPKALQRTLARAAVSLLPPVVRERLALGPEHDLSSLETLALRAAGAVAEKVAVRGAPPCQASLRLGLPYNFLYQRQSERRRALEARIVSAPRGTASL